MTKERMRELVEMYCDADRRGRIDTDQDNSPALVDIIDAMAY